MEILAACAWVILCVVFIAVRLILRLIKDLRATHLVSVPTSVTYAVTQGGDVTENE